MPNNSSVGIQINNINKFVIKMFQFKTNQKKGVKPTHLVESRRQNPKNQSFQLLDNSHVSRYLDRNQNANANINGQLVANYNQIKQLLNHRKLLLQSRFQSLIARNKQKLQSIATARDQDLRNQAKMLNDPSILNLVDQTQSLNKSKSLITQISEIKNMSSYQISQRNIGKQVYDRSKQIQTQRKKKSQIYAGHAKKLFELNQKERHVFIEIQRCENQIYVLCTKGRNDPDHIKRADKLNQQIQKKKNSLQQIQNEKNRIKETILNIIDDLLSFNEVNEKIYKNRLKDLDEIFIGSQNLSDFDHLMAALQKIIIGRNTTQRSQNNSNLAYQHLKQLLKEYENVSQDVDRLRQDEDMLFGTLNQELKQNIKNAVMEKAFLTGVVIKQDHNEILKKLKDYRRLLYDLDQERPRYQQLINKMNKMSGHLYPLKKLYATQDIRRQELKRQIKKLCALNGQIQSKQKQYRNFKYDMEQLLHKRASIQSQINDYAEKVNLTDYKKKMNELHAVNRQISDKNDALLHEEISRLRTELQTYFSRLEQNYADLINQVEIQDNRSSLGAFLTKLQKRLSLL